MVLPLISGTKLSDAQVRNLVWGFSCGAPKADISEQAGVSEKRVVRLVLALRPRLLRPAFYRWSAPSDVFLVRHWPEAQEATEQAVFGVMAMCYFDKRCVSNFHQKRRKNRICRHCMVAALFDDREAAELAVAFLDVIRSFYQHLGIGGERSTDQTEILHLRFRHTLIAQRAREHSTVRDGMPAFIDDHERSCRKLYDLLVADLRSEPLAAV